MSASSSSLSPPVQLRPRGSSVSGCLSLHSLAPRQQQPNTFPPTPQTPSSLVRKDTSSSIPVRFNPQARMLDEHPGSPHRPMLSVLLSLSVAALPPFVRPYGRAPRSRTRSPRTVSRAWVALDEDEQQPASPFTSLFLAPPPISLLPSPSDPATIRRQRSTQYYAPILLLLFLFALSLFPVAAALTSLPITAFRSFPKTLNDIAQLGHELKSYADNSPQGRLHVIAVLSITAIWKHAWSIPGSVVVNVIAGTILSPFPATLHMTLLTTLGSMLASLLSTPLSPLVSTLFPRALAITRSALQGNQDQQERSFYSEKLNRQRSAPKTPTWVRLVVMRLVGVVPWSGINVACGVCGISMWECFVGTFIGTLPWTAVTCQIGDIIQTLSAASRSASASSDAPQTLSSLLASPSIILKLLFLSALSLGPVLGREKLRLLGGGTAPTAEAASTAEKFPLNMEEGSEDEAVKEARWKFWKRSNSSGRRGSLDEEASVGDEEPTSPIVCASPPTIAPILVCEPVEMM